jgi:hypothetical protein
MEAPVSTTVPSYGDWDLLYVNALLEPDRNRLPARITAAEEAIKERLETLSNRDGSEKVALVEALRTLQKMRNR